MLAGLMGSEPESPLAAPVPARPARRGAVGAVSSAVADLRASAVLDLDPATIRPGGLVDRIGTDEAEDAELRRSMKVHGQQVPVLVRPHPGEPGAWQIVYGRRRVRAARDLGIAVKALVRDLDDEALVIAQGQENAARRDLSFIEKAGFARRMVGAGYGRAAIGDALAADKTLVSRMLSVADRVPEEIVRLVGAAHGVGRPRWIELADLLERRGATADDLRAVVAGAEGTDPASRFEAVLRHLGRGRGMPEDGSKATGPADLRADDGTRIARAKRSGRTGRLTIALDREDGFGDWLVERLPGLHAQWRSTKE